METSSIPIARSVFFCDQLRFATDGRNDLTGIRKNNARKFVQMRPQTRFFAWFVNLTPHNRARGSLNMERTGSHWTELLVQLPTSIDDIDRAFSRDGSLTVKVYFFDPMGGNLPECIHDEISDLLSTHLVGSLLRLNQNMARITEHMAEVVLNIQFVNLNMTVQIDDSVQCGVFCVWFLHQFVLSGALDSEMWTIPPVQDCHANRLEFRSWYFVQHEVQESAPDRPSKRAKIGEINSASVPIELDM